MTGKQRDMKMKVISRFHKVHILILRRPQNFAEIFPLLWTVYTVVKSKGKILQNFVAFSEYMNFSYVPLHK